MTQAQTIQIFLPTGDPSGLRMASIPTRTVQVFGVPRRKLAEFLARPEAAQVAVYFLFGEDEATDSPVAYIGQTSSAGIRLKQHNVDQSKDFWTRAVVAVSLTNEWTQTHVSYLEWESITLAKKAGRYRLTNGNGGSQPHTPEPLQADCDEFLSTIKQLVTTLGHPVLEVPKRGGSLLSPPDRPMAADSEPETSEDQGTPVFFRQRGADAEGVYSSEGLLVLAGSKGELRGDLTAANRAYFLRKVDLLVDEGVLNRHDDNSLTFTQDHLFSSPSAASVALIGRSSNGRLDWRDASGRSITQLDELQSTESTAAIAAG